MASSLVSDGATLRIEFSRPKWAPFAAFPLFCGAFYMFAATLLGLQGLAAETDRGISEYVSVLLFFICALAFSAPALMIACCRLFVIDKARGEVCRIFQFGPFKWRSGRQLSDFNHIEVKPVVDNDDGGRTYFVMLSSSTGADSVRSGSFDACLPANSLARELGGALDLPFREAPSRYRPEPAASGWR